MTTQHTPTPWNNEHPHGAVNVTDSTGRLVCSAGGYSDNFTPNVHDVNEANAAFIVRACNVYDELVSALKIAEKHVRARIADTGSKALMHDLKIIRAALTKAKKEASPCNQ